MFGRNKLTVILVITFSLVGVFSFLQISNNKQINKSPGSGSATQTSGLNPANDPYASTTVVINIPTDTSFTITVLGCSATTITASTESTATNSTGQISFNSTGANDKDVNAQSITGTGASCTTPTVQNGLTRPIIILQPAGNVNLNFSIRVDAAVPSDITFKFNGTLWNNTDGCLATATAPIPQVNSVVLSTSYQLLVRNLNKTSCAANITAFANFTGSLAGERRVGELLTNGTNLNS